jgi:hypothetical protein
MECLPDKAKVAYRSKDGKKKTYDALKWTAAMGSHILERGYWIWIGHHQVSNNKNLTFTRIN